MGHFFSNGAGLVNVWGRPDPHEAERRRLADEAAKAAAAKRAERRAIRSKDRSEPSVPIRSRFSEQHIETITEILKGYCLTPKIA
jgi:hypothetical protein